MSIEGPCLANTRGCEGTPDYLWADRAVYQRVKVYEDPNRTNSDGMWAKPDDHDLKPAPIETEEDLEDLRCPTCGETVNEAIELHKVKRFLKFRRALLEDA